MTLHSSPNICGPNEILSHVDSKQRPDLSGRSTHNAQRYAEVVGQVFTQSQRTMHIIRECKPPMGGEFMYALSHGFDSFCISEIAETLRVVKHILQHRVYLQATNVHEYLSTITDHQIQAMKACPRR